MLYWQNMPDNPTKETYMSSKREGEIERSKETSLVKRKFVDHDHLESQREPLLLRVKNFFRERPVSFLTSSVAGATSLVAIPAIGPMGVFVGLASAVASRYVEGILEDRMHVRAQGTLAKSNYAIEAERVSLLKMIEAQNVVDPTHKHIADKNQMIRNAKKTVETAIQKQALLGGSALTAFASLSENILKAIKQEATYENSGSKVALERIVNDNLPRTLETFFNLPKVGSEQSRMALIEQLGLINTGVIEIIQEADNQRETDFSVNGIYLKDKFKQITAEK